MRFTEITDDLTGAADSGSYFTARGQQLKICTSGESSLNRSDNELLSVNLCSRNVEGEVARRVHSALLKRLSKETGHIYMKKSALVFEATIPMSWKDFCRPGPTTSSFSLTTRRIWVPLPSMGISTARERSSPNPCMLRIPFSLPRNPIFQIFFPTGQSSPLGLWTLIL